MQLFQIAKKISLKHIVPKLNEAYNIQPRKDFLLEDETINETNVKLISFKNPGDGGGRSPSYRPIFSRVKRRRSLAVQFVM